jgi:hypothetical protein
MNGAPGERGTRSWCPAPGIKLTAASVRLAVPRHGAADSEKFGNKKGAPPKVYIER